MLTISSKSARYHTFACIANCTFWLVWAGFWVHGLVVSQEVRWWFVPLLFVVPLVVWASEVWILFGGKTVKRDNDLLYISGLRREVTVPIGEVERMSKSVMPGLMWLHFRRGTVFGQRIVFQVKYKKQRGIVWGPAIHPDVKELGRRIEEAAAPHRKVF